VAKCPKCGKEIEKEGHRHCSACSLKHDVIRHGEGGLYWETPIPLVANSVLWRDLVFALGIPVLIIAVIVVLFSNAQDRMEVVFLFGVLFGIFLLIALVVMVTLSRSLGGGLDAKFYVNNAGVGYEAGHPAKKLNRGTLILSLMSGSINAAGTTLIAISQEENFISWQDVHSVKIYTHPKVIHIRSKELINPIALYCTPENFGKVTEMISNKIPLAAIR
jgi:preprotein translocase subunit SecG